MAKLFVLVAMVALIGCGPRMTHEQIKAVTDACHAQGMEYKVRGNDVICWTRNDK